VLGYKNGVDVVVEDVRAELRVGWLGQRHGGAARRARRSAAELTETTTERNGRR